MIQRSLIIFSLILISSTLTSCSSYEIKENDQLDTCGVTAEVQSVNEWKIRPNAWGTDEYTNVKLKLKILHSSRDDEENWKFYKTCRTGKEIEVNIIREKDLDDPSIKFYKNMNISGVIDISLQKIYHLQVSEP